jgi:hypothetical protein
MQFVAGDFIYSMHYLDNVEASLTEQSSDDEGNRLLPSFDFFLIEMSVH